MYDFTSVLMYRNKSNPDWNDLLIFNISTLDSPISLYVYDAVNSMRTHKLHVNTIFLCILQDIKQDTTLGIGTVDLRENSYILDGEDHDIVVEIQKPQKKKKNKKGKKSPPSPTTVTLSSSSRSSSSSNSDDDSKKPSIDLDYDEDDDYETNDVIEKKTTVTLKVKCYFDASKVKKKKNT